MISAPCEERRLKEVTRTTDRVLLSAIHACLAEYEIDFLPFDENIGAIYSAVFPIRVVVRDEDFDLARDALRERGLLGAQ